MAKKKEEQAEPQKIAKLELTSNGDLNKVIEKVNEIIDNA